MAAAGSGAAALSVVSPKVSVAVPASSLSSSSNRTRWLGGCYDIEAFTLTPAAASAAAQQHVPCRVASQWTATDLYPDATQKNVRVTTLMPAGMTYRLALGLHGKELPTAVSVDWLQRVEHGLWRLMTFPNASQSDEPHAVRIRVTARSALDVLCDTLLTVLGVVDIVKLVCACVPDIVTRWLSPASPATRAALARIAPVRYVAPTTPSAAAAASAGAAAVVDAVPGAGDEQDAKAKAAGDELTAIRAYDIPLRHVTAVQQERVWKVFAQSYEVPEVYTIRPLLDSISPVPLRRHADSVWRPDTLQSAIDMFACAHYNAHMRVSRIDPHTGLLTPTRGAVRCTVETVRGVPHTSVNGTKLILGAVSGVCDEHGQLLPALQPAWRVGTVRVVTERVCVEVIAVVVVAADSSGGHSLPYYRPGVHVAWCTNESRFVWFDAPR